MRKLLRSMAKAQMKKMGADKINKRMRYNWRRVVGAYPIDTMTGEKMREDYHGRKEYRPGTYSNHLFFYNWRFIKSDKAPGKKRRGLLKRA